MNLDDLTARVGALLGEDRAAAQSRLYTPEQCEIGVKESNRALWRYAVECSQSYFSKRKVLDVSEEYVDLASRTVDAAGVYLVTKVERDDGVGSWVPMDPIVGQDSYERVGLPTHYFFEGDKMYLSPIPNQPVRLRLRYIPRCADLDSTTEAFNGSLTEFHEVVAYDAAIPFAIKDQADPKGLIYRRDELKGQMRDYLLRRQRQSGRQIRYVGD